MKYVIKIAAMYCIAANIFFNLYPIRILSELDFSPSNQVQDHSIVICEQSPEFLARVGPSQKDTDFRPFKLITFGKLHTKASFNHFEFISLKKYIQQNELVFNLPRICFKFPLSEHTEEG